jgi:hypothetical protein
MLHHRSFLADLSLDYGPIDLLGRFFPRADAAARNSGVYLSFGTCEELVKANKDNRENWLPLVPVFDPACGDVTPENTFCVLARDEHGAVVAAHAARLYAWIDTDFVEEMSSLRIFYRNPPVQKRAGEACEVAAAAARCIRGKVVYSGAAWVHPEFRGRNLSSILPRVAKAYALTRWNPDVVVSLMTETVYNGGFLPRFGYNHIAWDVVFRNASFGNLRFAVVWMDIDFLIQDLTGYLTRTAEQVDVGILNGRPQQLISANR